VLITPRLGVELHHDDTQLTPRCYRVALVLTTDAAGVAGDDGSGGTRQAAK